MSTPTRAPAARTTTQRPTSAALDATTQATADLSKPRPAMMDRLHMMSADGARTQQTLGNQMSQRLAQERRVTGDARPNGTTSPVAAPSAGPATRTADDGDRIKSPRLIAPEPVEPVADTRPQPAVVPPPGPVTALGVAEVEPSAPAPASTIADVQAQVTRATNALPRPVAGGFSAAHQAIRAQGFRQANAYSGAGGGAKKSRGGGGGGRVEDPTRPPEPDPVPKQTKALADIAKQKLTEVPRLGFQATPAPRKHMPKLGMRPLSVSDLQVLLAAPTPERKRLMQEENEKRLAEREAKHAKEQAGKSKPGKAGEKKVIKPGDDEPKTFDEMRAMLVARPAPEAVKDAAKKKVKDKEVDDSVPKYIEPPPPGPVVFGEAKKAELSKVLAGVLAESDKTAKEILHLIRPNVVSKVRLGAALERAFPTIGESQQSRVETSLKNKVATLQQGANITDAELAKAVEERRQELIRIRADAAASKTQAEIDAKREIREKAKEEAAAAAAEKASADAKAGLVKKAAPKVKLPMDVDARKARLLDYVNRDVADIVVKFRQKGEIRAMTVARIARDYIDAYTFAMQQDVYEISTTAADPKSAAVGEALKTTREWLDRMKKDVEDFKTAQNKIDEAEVSKLQGQTRTAGIAKSEAIRAWAEKTSGKKRTEEWKYADRAMDWSKQHTAEVMALTNLLKGRLALGVSNDFDVVSSIAAEVQKGTDRETIIANLRLNSMQVAMLDAYLEPPEPGDDKALSGAMAGLRVRLQMELTPEIAPQMEQEILEKHSDDIAGLNQIGGVQTPGFDSTKIAQAVHAAVDKMDTDEEAVYDNLANLTKIQAQAIRLAYKEEYKGSTIEGDLKGGAVYGMSGNELRRAQTLLEGDQKTADAIGYRIALKGNEGAWYHTGLGSGDIEALDKINHGKSLEERQAAEDAYNRENDPALRSQLDQAKNDADRDAVMKRYRDAGKSQLLTDANESLATERHKERFKYSVAGDDDTADALELRDKLPTPADMRQMEAMGHQHGQSDMGKLVVADRKKVEAIYDRMRREVTARGDRERWTSSQIEAEIARRAQKIEKIFDSKFADDYESKGKGALRTAYDFGFRHQEDEKNLANALADNDTAKLDAAKVHIEHRGVYADDDILNAVLAKQYQRALADQRRDEMPLRKIIMAREMVQIEKDARKAAFKAAKDRGATDEQAEKEAQAAWDAKKQWAARERLQRGIDRTLEMAAIEQAKGNMNALRHAYNRDYGGNLDEVIKSDTSGYDADKAELLLAQHGRLTLGQTMFYAIRGSGTDEEALNTLKGHTKAEIDIARAEFKQLALAERNTPRGILNRIWDEPGVDQTDMDSQIAADLSGRTGFDVAQLLKGEPETIDEKRERLLEAINWEKNSGPLGRALTADQGTALDNQLARLDATIQKMSDPNLTAEERDVYIGFFEQGVVSVEAGIKANREMLDTWTDRITTAVGLVIGIAVTILTFGAAGIVLAAVIGSILATASTIALKAAILGNAYGWEDIGTDVVVGIVDAVAAALTAGMGSKLLGAAKSAAAPTASRLAFGRAVQRSLAAGGRLAVINPAESALARAVPTSAFLKGMVERGGLGKVLAITLAEGGENLIANAPSALATNLLDENNYKGGNVIGNILSGTVRQAGVSAGMGLAMKGGMSVGKGVREFPGRMFDALKTPAAPELHNFALAKKEFPDITYEEFSKLRVAATLESRARATGDVPEVPRKLGDVEGGERLTERQPLAEQRVPGEEVGAARGRDAGAPPKSDPSVIGDADLTTPRQLTEAHARELVPPSLREKLTVTIDTAQAPGTVKVERVMRLGVVVDIKLVVGPHVRPIDVVMHGQTVHAMQRYLGVTGAVVRAIERMRSIIVRDGLPPFGTKAWESMHELNKLPRLIEQRLEMLRTGAMDPRAEAAIHADIERIARQVDKHRVSFDMSDRSKGTGYIAMEGDYTKAPAPLPDRAIPRSDRGNPSHQRYLAEHSALKSKFPNARFLSVGPAWVEMTADGPRIYRILEVRDPKTNELKVRREEILQTVDRFGRPVEHWVRRGSDTNVVGEVGERAFQIEFEADQALGRRANQILLPPGVVQRGGGQGFDGVILEFRGKQATIILIEVKNYPGRYVPLLDITAIRENLNDNLTRLREQLNNAGERKRLGLSRAQAQQAIEAIDKQRLEFELRLGDTTRLGDVANKNATVLKELRNDIAAERPGISLSQDNVRAARIGETPMRTAEAFIEARERLGTPKELDKLARGRGGLLTEHGVRSAEAALTVQKKTAHVDPPLEPGATPHSFIDSKRNRFTVVAPERGKPPAKVASEVAQNLRATRPLQGKPTRIILDVTHMTVAQQRAMRRELMSLAKKAPRLDLGLVVLVDTGRSTATPFHKAPK